MLLSLLHTPMPPSTRYRNATAIIQTKNSATDSTADTFKVLHGSTRRICMLARTGPGVRDDTWIRASERTGAVIVLIRALGSRLPLPSTGNRAGQVGQFTGVRIGLPALVRRGCLSASGAGALAAPGAAVPEMNRFSRASALGAGPRPG